MVRAELSGKKHWIVRALSIKFAFIYSGFGRGFLFGSFLNFGKIPWETNQDLKLQKEFGVGEDCKMHYRIGIVEKWIGIGK